MRSFPTTGRFGARYHRRHAAARCKAAPNARARSGPSRWYYVYR